MAVQFRALVPAVRRPPTAPPPPLPLWRRRGVPQPSWLFALIMLVAFMALLAFEAYVHAEFQPDGRIDTGPVGYQTVPDPISSGGSLIDTTNAQVSSYRLPPRTIALTFDDGPDPVWTPRVREVLRRHGVPGTFFVVGSAVARDPELVRDLAADGNELGVHTFTHPDMVALPAWRRTMEYSETQMAIADAAGIKTALLRFPYSSSADALNDLTWPLVLEAGQQGYLTIVTDSDSNDWQRPGVDTITRLATPPGDSGGTVLMHDAGGDRSQTVAALDRLIPALKAKGYRFVTVSEGLRLARAANPDAPGAIQTTTRATSTERWRGSMLVWSVRSADAVYRFVDLLLIVAGALVLLRTALLLVLAGYHARRRRSAGWSWGPPVTAPVSVIVPAYNERANIAAAVTSLATSEYPELEVVVVDDGSTDGTADIVEALGLPNVRLVRVPNGGKPRALNVGISHAQHDLIIMVDGDTVFEPGSVTALVQPFADPTVGAVAGNVKVSNRRSLLGGWQHIEYALGFNLDRRLYDVMQCMPTIPGAIGAFRREALRDAGGVNHRTLAEDTDLTMAITRAGWRVVYEATARAHTETPATVQQLWRQRYRWSYGTMQAMWIHRRAVVESGPSGRFGRIGLPFLTLFGVVLPLLAPLVDVLTVYGFVIGHPGRAAVAWLIMLATQILTAVIAFRLDREPIRGIWMLPLQQFAYRQLIYVVMMRSILSALTGARLRWQQMHRTGAAAALYSRR